MRLASWVRDGLERFGAVDDDGGLRDLTGWAAQPTLRSVLDNGMLPLLQLVAGDARVTGRIDDTTLLAPVPQPDKCLCLGFGPAGDAGIHHLVLRSPGSIVGHGQPLLRPAAGPGYAITGGIVLVVGRAGRHIAAEEAIGYLAGATLCIAGRMQGPAIGPTQGMNFNRSGSIGPCMVTADAIDLAAPLELTLRVNGAVRQQASTARLPGSLAHTVAGLSAVMTLLPGDLIVIGLPGGGDQAAQWPVAGDMLEAEVPGIGTLANPVADEAPIAGQADPALQ